MLVVGSIIGSGIFKKPALMAGQLGSGELLILVWIIAGIMTMFGALTNAEIASIITSPGGQYIYFNKIYNKFVGYLYGWSVFSVYQTGSILATSSLRSTSRLSLKRFIFIFLELAISSLWPTLGRRQ
jgi:APA family basic amino acid/polyamine antiporter